MREGSPLETRRTNWSAGPLVVCVCGSVPTICDHANRVNRDLPQCTPFGSFTGPRPRNALPIRSFTIQRSRDPAGGDCEKVEQYCSRQLLEKSRYIIDGATDRLALQDRRRQPTRLKCTVLINNIISSIEVGILRIVSDYLSFSLSQGEEEQLIGLCLRPLARALQFPYFLPLLFPLSFLVCRRSSSSFHLFLTWQLKRLLGDSV